MNRALLAQLDSAYELFTRSAGTLTEDHSSFAPADGGFTAANQVAHAAHTIDWFISGRSTTPRRSSSPGATRSGRNRCHRDRFPRSAIFGAFTNHTAHQRGALTVYTRLLEKTPPTPYMDASRPVTAPSRRDTRVRPLRAGPVPPLSSAQ